VLRARPTPSPIVRVLNQDVNGLNAFGLDFRFLPAPYEPRFEAVLPPSVEQIAEGMRRSPDALAVMYTSPTYEGLTADTRGIASVVHEMSEAAADRTPALA
jgi:arginine decarboxylase